MQKIFNHPKILNSPTLTDMAMVSTSKPILTYKQLRVYLDNRVAQLVAAKDFEEAKDMTQNYLDVGTMSADANDLTEEIKQSTQMGGLLHTLRRNFESVSQMEMQAYFDNGGVAPSATEMKQPDEQTQADLQNTYDNMDLYVFLENLQTYGNV